MYNILCMTTLTLSLWTENLVFLSTFQPCLYFDHEALVTYKPSESNIFLAHHNSFKPLIEVKVMTKTRQQAYKKSDSLIMIL